MTPSDAPVTATGPAAAAAVSGHLDTRTAATEVSGDLQDRLAGTCDLAFLFASFHHVAAFAEAAEAVRGTLRPRVFLATTAESVAGLDEELEGLAGMVVLAMRLPGVDLTPWSFRADRDGSLLGDPQALRRRLGIGEGLRAVVMLADPFTTPVTALLPAVTGSGGERPVPVVGGMSSGASQPGINVLALDGQILRGGAVGVTIAGGCEVDIVVSQGCRPIGKPIVVTKARGNVIQELGGHPALEAIQEMAGSLEHDERELLSGGLLLGTVVNEYKQRFGRGDFLVRNVLGYDKQHGAIAVGDLPRVGQTVQFHVRDAATAHEDLQLLLDGQQVKDPTLAALLFTCNGRGSRLFSQRHHDVRTIRQRLGEVPLAGFFAAGEFGPIGDRSFLHGHTASLALLRPTLR
jgi:small ligand-binding sensory domain FIST